MTPIFAQLSESKNGLVKFALFTAISFPLFSSLVVACLIASPIIPDLVSLLVYSLLSTSVLGALLVNS